MNNNNLINEEVNRIKLLFNYDSQQTLSENLEGINEQGLLRNLLRTDTAVARTAARELETGLVGLKGGVTRMDGVLLRDADDIIKAVKAGKLAPAELGKVNAALLKNTTNPAVKKAVIQDVVNTSAFTTKYGTKTEAEAIAALEAKGWSKADAKAAVSEYKSSGNAFKGGKSTTRGTTTSTKSRTTRAKSNNFKKGNVTNWTKYKETIKGFTRSKTFKYLVAAGGLYLAWKWFTSQDATPLPECITRSASPQDIEKMATEGLEYAVVTTTGNDTIDKNGGGLFYDDGKFVTGNNRYTGKWSEEGGKVIMSIGSKQFPMDCEGTDKQDETDDTGNGGGGGGGTTYRSCTSFPYEKGCKGKIISDIQGCIGTPVDGKYGNKTETALRNKGYGTTITQDVYNKIMSDCGKGETTTTTTTIYNPERTSYGSTDV